MRSINYCITKEPPHYVAQCLNVEVSSFGATVEEAVSNLREAVELFFEDNEAPDFREVEEAYLGQSVVNA